jgi:ribosomal-protein-alanine N-acetyltransferase
MQAMLAYGFETLQFIRIAAVVYIENEASRNLLTKVGFQEEGLLRKYMIQNDVAHDTVVYSLLKEDWQK